MIGLQKAFAFGAALAATASCAHAQQAPQQEMAPPAVSALTMMSAAVPATNLDKSLDFYTNGLGMVALGRIEQASVTEAPLQFPGGGPYVMLLYPKRPGTVITPRGSLNRIILAVPDLKALEARLIAAGYKLKAPIVEIAQYKVAVGHVEDPDGNQIELVQRSK